MSFRAVMNIDRSEPVASVRAHDGRRCQFDWPEFQSRTVRPRWSRLTTAVVRAASIGPGTKQADRFSAFGDGSMIRFPQVALMNEGHIEIGSNTMIGQNITLSAGTIPDQEGMPDCVVKIGDRCLIGQGSGIVGHLSIDIGDDMMTGHLVYITDQNHGFDDVTLPIRAQWGSNRAVRIGSGSWIGHGSVILPGANIGRNVVIGAEQRGHRNDSRLQRGGRRARQGDPHRGSEAQFLARQVAWWRAGWHVVVAGEHGHLLGDRNGDRGLVERKVLAGRAQLVCIVPSVFDEGPVIGLPERNDLQALGIGRVRRPPRRRASPREYRWLCRPRPLAGAISSGPAPSITRKSDSAVRSTVAAAQISSARSAHAWSSIRLTASFEAKNSAHVQNATNSVAPVNASSRKNHLRPRLFVPAAAPG